MGTGQGGRLTAMPVGTREGFPSGPAWRSFVYRKQLGAAVVVQGTDSGVGGGGESDLSQDIFSKQMQ